MGIWASRRRPSAHSLEQQAPAATAAERPAIGWQHDRSGQTVLHSGCLRASASSRCARLGPLPRFY